MTVGKKEDQQVKEGKEKIKGSINMNKATTQPQCINITLTMEEKYLLKHNYKLSKLPNIKDAPGNTREEKTKIAYPHDADGTPGILIIEISCTRKRPYVSITGEVHEILTVEEAEENTLEYLREDDELWKQAVEVGDTEESREGFNNQLFNDYGYEVLYDTSLYPDIHTINGNDYILNGYNFGCIHDTILESHPEYKPLIKDHLKTDFNTVMKFRQIIRKLETQLPTLEKQVQKILENTIKQTPNTS